MVIELVLLFVFAAAVGVAVVKVIEWRMDVLYGPYLARDGVKQKQGTQDHHHTNEQFEVVHHPAIAAPEGIDHLLANFQVE
jgi:hypothetical protein